MRRSAGLTAPCWSESVSGSPLPWTDGPGSTASSLDEAADPNLTLLLAACGPEKRSARLSPVAAGTACERAARVSGPGQLQGPSPTGSPAGIYGVVWRSGCSRRPCMAAGVHARGWLCTGATQSGRGGPPVSAPRRSSAPGDGGPLTARRGPDPPPRLPDPGLCEGLWLQTLRGGQGPSSPLSHSGDRHAGRRPWYRAGRDDLGGTHSSSDVSEKLPPQSRTTANLRFFPAGNVPQTPVPTRGNGRA